MSLFEEIKNKVTTREVAEHYGLKVKRNGMAVCPFHQDKNPSLKVDKTFYCFGCGAKGDCINYVAEILGLSQFDAAKKINEDMGLQISLAEKEQGETKKVKKKKTREERIFSVQKKFEKWVRYARDVLLRYLCWLKFWKEFYKPEEGEEWHPLFQEALKNETLILYYLEILDGNEEKDKIDFFRYNRQEVENIERRMEEYQRGVLEELRRDYGG